MIQSYRRLLSGGVEINPQAYAAQYAPEQPGTGFRESQNCFAYLYILMIL